MEITYAGKELEIFEQATVWKNYFSSLVKPYLKGKILEVGAGIGSTTLHLCDGSQQKWVCVEPDPKLFAALTKKLDSGSLPDCCSAINTTTEFLPAEEKFDAILYIDVIEHIEEDSKELDVAKNLLAPGGFLIVLSPAHQFLFSPFDKAIGHYRRYNKSMIKAKSPMGMKIVQLSYLDSMGIFASGVNKLLFKQSYPSPSQINFWDKVLVRISKIIDRITFYKIGKSILVIWKKI